MYRKIGIKLTTNYSYNFSIPKRSKDRVKFIIIHYTGMKTESTAIKRLQDPKSKVSSHYYVCLLYTSPSPRDKRQSRMPSSA